jgi:hypothetical protein
MLAWPHHVLLLVIGLSTLNQVERLVWDQIVGISQMKMVIQEISGTKTGAEQTKENYLNTNPLLAIVYHYHIAGKQDETKKNWKNLRNLAERVVGSLPDVRYVKEEVSYAIGERERGAQLVNSASRAVGMMIVRGVGGFFDGVRVEDMAGGIAAGSAADKSITGKGF